jgi:methylmalonyl-CoA mutase, C-terminal domain
VKDFINSAAILAGKRILVAKPGLDGHDAGAKIIALALRDAGADVIYTGLRKTPDYIARLAVDEDVHAVGLSILSGSHNELVKVTAARLVELGALDVRIFVGGTIPAPDHARLRAAGAAEIFSADMPLDAVIRRIAELLQ